MLNRKLIGLSSLAFCLIILRHLQTFDQGSPRSLIITTMAVPNSKHCDWSGVFHLIDDAQRVDADLAIFSNIECPLETNSTINIYIQPPNTRWSVGMWLTNETITNVREGARHVFDARWYWYHDFLLDLKRKGWKRNSFKYDSILFVDVKDVVVIHNPAKCMKRINPLASLWISQEYQFNTNPWMGERYQWCGLNSSKFLNQRIVNAGLVGATPNKALWLAKEMTTVLNQVLKTATDLDHCMIYSSDMCAFNKVIYKVLDGANDIFVGEPFAITYKNGPHLIYTDSKWPDNYNAFALDENIVANCTHDKYNGTADAECQNGLIPYCAIHKWSVVPIQ